jgi:hypothetical protein
MRRMLPLSPARERGADYAHLLLQFSPLDWTVLDWGEGWGEWRVASSEMAMLQAGGRAGKVGK